MTPLNKTNTAKGATSQRDLAGIKRPSGKVKNMISTATLDIKKNKKYKRRQPGWATDNRKPQLNEDKAPVVIVKETNIAIQSSERRQKIT